MKDALGNVNIPAHILEKGEGFEPAPGCVKLDVEALRLPTREELIQGDPVLTRMVGHSVKIATVLGSLPKGNKRTRGQRPHHTIHVLIHRDGTVEPSCTCQSFRIQKNGNCKHTDRMKQALALAAKEQSKNVLYILRDWSTQLPTFE